MTPDQIVRHLNEQYIEASMTSDVEWFRSHLAEEFMCIESDGSLLDKSAFLRAAALPSDLAEYSLQGVDLRFYGNVALVRATGLWTSRAGVRGMSRYMDLYLQSGDTWKVVSAQVTRPANVNAARPR